MKHHGNYETADVNDIASNNASGYVVYVRQALKKIKDKYHNDKRHSDKKKRKLVGIYAYNRRNR